MNTSSNAPLSILRITGALAAFATALSAQDLTPKAARQTTPIYLHNAKVHTVSGATLPRAGVLLVDGKIKNVIGPNQSVDLPPNTRSVNLAGSHIYPGLVTARTSLGLAEIGSVPMSIDTSEVGDITPEAQANTAVNPDSTAIPVARSNGILTAGVFPSGGLVSGRASAMTTDGWTWQDMTLVADLGLVIQWPRRDRAKRIEKLDELLAKARAWHAASKADPTVPSDLRYLAMGPALEGKTRVFILANDLASMTSAVTWSKRQSLQPVIVGARDAVLCASLLKRHKVPVIVSGTHSLPKRRDSRYDERFRLPAQLHAKKIQWCLGSGGSYSSERNLPYHAASAVAFGLSEQEAIRSITWYPAQVLGIADRVGSIQEGLDATLLITNGSPLDLTTVIETAFIQGRQVSLHNKQRALAEKYRRKYQDLPGAQARRPKKKSGTKDGR